jgi:hypothetical protein
MGYEGIDAHRDMPDSRLISGHREKPQRVAIHIPGGREGKVKRPAVLLLEAAPFRRVSVAGFSSSSELIPRYVGSSRNMSIAC